MMHSHDDGAPQSNNKTKILIIPDHCGTHLVKNKLDEEGNIVKTTQVFPPSSDEKKGGLGGLAGKMVG